jgi:leucyl aminopeptidase
MKIDLEKKGFENLNNKSLILFSDDKKKILSEGVKLDKDFLEYEIGKKKSITTFLNTDLNVYKNVFVVGLGSVDELTGEDVRRIASLVLKTIKSNKLNKATIATPVKINKSLNQNDFVEKFSQGLQITDFSYNENMTAKKEKDAGVHFVFSNIEDLKSAKEALTEAQIVAEQVNFARKLGDAPGNLMTPTILADETEAAAKGTGIKVTVWDKARIKKEKFGGLLGVSMGSDQDPRFIIMEYKGAGPSATPICFVGKGLTFDAGGISIKPGAGMDEMKYDMCGAAAVIGATLAIAKLKLKVNVITLVPSSENLLGGSATKPGDIHKFRNGKTAEILNTDAEGRLILADALSYATEQKPQVIFDAATLTGAMVVALGNCHTGFFTKFDGLAKTINEASESSEEPLWRLPLTSEHSDDVKGTFADLSNIGSGKGAGSATAAAFLSEFVDAKIPWAHFDIAGTAWNCGNRREYLPKKGATGVLVRTFVELAKTYSK